MKGSDVGLFDECFTHIAEDGTQTTWASKALYAFCEANPDKCEKVLAPVDEDHAKFCVEQRGVEQDRLQALAENIEYLKKPILFVKMPTEDMLLVDGTHRYVCYYAAGVPSIPAYVVPFEHAKAFIIEDAPTMDEKALMTEHSGISILRKLGLG